MNLVVKPKILYIEYLLVFFVKILLDFSYLNYVSKYYSYSGFNYQFSFNNYLIGWIIYVLGYWLLYNKKGINIYEIFYLIYFLYILPTITFFSLSDKQLNELLLLILPYFVILFFINNKNKTLIFLPPIKNGKLIVLLTSIIIILIVLYNYFLNTSGNMVFKFSEVYIFRSKYGETTSSGLYGYLNNWAGKVFSVLILAWSLKAKNYLWVFISILFIGLLFFLSGHKSVLQGLFIVIFFYLLSKTKNTRILILYGFCGLLIISTAAYLINPSSYISSILIRRLLFLPVKINFTYLEYFSIHDKIYWSNSILKSIYQYPYDLKPAFLIGDYLYSSKDPVHANTGFIASGYMQAGYFGVLIYTFLSVLIFKLINTYSLRNSKFISFSILFIPINTLFFSSDFFTTLLTHGLLIAILCLCIFNEKKYYLKFNNTVFMKL